MSTNETIRVYFRVWVCVHAKLSNKWSTWSEDDWKKSRTRETTKWMEEGKRRKKKKKEEKEQKLTASTRRDEISDEGDLKKDENIDYSLS